MTRKKAIILGWLTFWPLLYVIIFIISVFATVKTGVMNGEPPSIAMLILFGGVALLHVVAMASLCGMPIYYIIHMFKSDVVPEQKRVPWTVALLVCNIVAMPAFWYVYIWNNCGIDNLNETDDSGGSA